MVVRHFTVAFATVLLSATASFAAAPQPVDPCNAPISDGPVKGTVMGKPFLAGAPTIYSVTPYMGRHVIYYLTFLNKPGDDVLEVGVAMRGGKLPDGKTFRYLPVSDFDKQPKVDSEVREVETWQLQFHETGLETGEIRDNAGIRLELGTRKNGIMPGRISFCIPTKNTLVTGSFNAEIVRPNEAG